QCDGHLQRPDRQIAFHTIAHGPSKIYAQNLAALQMLLSPPMPATKGAFRWEGSLFDYAQAQLQRRLVTAAFSTSKLT
ncbi:hypothetical protein, partial [Roseovarius sp.]|uniref:hypothetical protein n=1 Tax=Roseovarius sp. TaxID=1486281 RepID=UPI003A97F8CD